jgi:hypothetical protein
VALDPGDTAAAAAVFPGECLLDEGLNWKQLWGVRHYLSPHRFVTYPIQPELPCPWILHPASCLMKMLLQQ